MVMTRYAREERRLGLPVLRTPATEVRLVAAESRDAGTEVNIVLTVRSDARYLSLIRTVTVDMCGSLGLADDIADGVKLAVGEAVANAMEHGSPNGSADSVTVVFGRTDDSLRVEIIDEGPGICMPIDIRKCRRRNRGFGLKLMESLMDKVYIEDAPRGTHLVMTKRLPN